MDREKIEQCAKNIIKCVAVEPGECIYIKGGIYCQDLLEEIGLEALRKGVIPHISSTTDYFSEQIYHDGEITIETLEKTPIHVLKLVENISTYIVIEPYEDPSIQNQFPREKLFASSKASTPIKDVIYGGKPEYEPGKKWLYAGWPSPKAAKFYNIDYSLLEKFIIDGMSVPVDTLRGLTEEIGTKLENAKKVIVTDELGTDFWVCIKDRRINHDAGLISQEQIQLGDLGGNLPAGEVFIAPREKEGEGKIFCPLTIDRYSNKIIKNILLPFKEGKLVIDKVECEDNLDEIISSFAQCEEIDRNRDLEEIRTYNLAELGIGCNPQITRAIGYILTDEKIGGSVHVAFGDNKQYGGTSVSQMHWDFVTAPKATIEVEYKDGDKKLIMEEGKLL